MIGTQPDPMPPIEALVSLPDGLDNKKKGLPELWRQPVDPLSPP
jgi:hypothetical protein